MRPSSTTVAARCGPAAASRAVFVRREMPSLTRALRNLNQVPGIVGTVKIASEAEPDPSALVSSQS